MKKTKIVHTCYGCSYYYKINSDGQKVYLEPYSYRHCNIENPWNCDRFADGGIENKNIKGGE